MDKTRAFERLIDNSPLGAKLLAAALGLSPTTLRHKSNPRDSKQFFSPEEGIQLQRETQDFGPLQVEAEALGFTLLRSPAALTSEEAAQLLNSMVREFGQYLSEATSALSDKNVTANEMDRVDAECMDAIAALQALRAHIAALHEAAKPPHLRDVAAMRSGNAASR